MRRRQPAFGIVGAPVESADAAAHGFVPRDRLRLDSDGPDPALDACTEAARRGDWRSVAAALPPVGGDPDRYHRMVCGVAELAVNDDAWLTAWLDGAPDDPGAWSVHARAMVRLAWQLRSGALAKDLLPEQWAGFHRVLGQAPAACARATSLAADLATPWIELLACARGLSWDHDRFRDTWAQVVARAPRSVPAHITALQYWLPRWSGSTELAEGFVADTLARATPGTLLTGVRLEYLFQERGPSFPGGELAEAIDAALADLAAAPADHPYRTRHRHWLAYFLTKAGRYAEAVEQFRAVDGYVGARPWDVYGDPAGVFSTTRAEALLGWQRAS